MILKITQADIDAATAVRDTFGYDKSSACVVAKAFLRTTGAEDVRVGRSTIYDADDDSLYVLPSDLTMYIQRFDRFEPVRPATFEITLVPE